MVETMDNLSRSFWTEPAEGVAGLAIQARVVSDGAAPHRRRSPRKPLEVETTVRELGAAGVEARVLNLSAHGFMAASDSEFAPGTRVWLLLPGQPRANALVRWCRRGRFGAEFAAPVDPLAVLVALGRNAAS